MQVNIMCSKLQPLKTYSS